MCVLQFVVLIVCGIKASAWNILQGRFTLRDEGRTIAIGKIIKLPSGKKDIGDNAFSTT
jgi:translation elongation factor EF-1alpha